MSNSLKTTLAAVIVLLLLCIYCACSYISFGWRCEAYIKRAADANTVELATQEMERVVKYLEDRGMTSGFTSIMFNTADEDVGFWFSNLKSSLEELRRVGSGASALEKSNLLMKLRETLVDQTKDGVIVTSPAGIARYPYNGRIILLAIACVVVFFGSLVFGYGPGPRRRRA